MRNGGRLQTFARDFYTILLRVLDIWRNFARRNTKTKQYEL